MKTAQDKLISIDLGDATGVRQLPYAKVHSVIDECINLSNYALAASVAVQLAKQVPDDFPSQSIAAESLHLHQQTEPAFFHINRALEIEPKNVGGLVTKSRLCLYAGDPEQAIRLIDYAISLAPENPKLHSVRGELLTTAGDVAGARNSYLRSVELDVRNSGSLIGLARLPGDNFSEALLKKVEFIVQSRQLQGKDQIKAHFALAHAYDKKADISRHFAHLDAGNELKRHSAKFNSTASELEVRHVTEFFSEEFFAQQMPRKGNPARLVFIVGFPRCGSTLIEQILCSHPAVSGAGEINALYHAARDIGQENGLQQDYPNWIDNQPAGVFAAIADNYLQRVAQFNQNVVMTDKLLNNYVYAGLIHLIFPNAKIVNVQRNPIDVCYSCYKHLFSLNAVPYTYSLEHLAVKYSHYQQVISHWHKVLPGKIHTVMYEQLVGRQEEVTRALLEHCELPWDDACMSFHDSDRAVYTVSNVQVRQKLYSDSVDRWKIHKNYLGPLMKLTDT